MRSVATGLSILRLVLLSGLAGCAGPMARVEKQFAEGRYPDAKQTLESLEAESQTWTDAKRAEYALYRGLTHTALGDRERAGLWLRQARAIEDAHPGSLSPEDRQRLKVGLDSSDLGP
jgi:hypothetical protein